MSNPYYNNPTNNAYELNTYNNNSSEPASNPYEQYNQQAAVQQSGNDDVSFYNDINAINASLDDYNILVSQVQSNQTRLLNEVNEQEAYRLQSSLDSLTARTSSLQQDIKARIQAVLNKCANDANKANQVQSVKENFLQSIQNYRTIEADAKLKTKEQAIRQYQVVEPNASYADASSAIDDFNGNQQIFSQALLNSNVKGQAQSALNEVKERHRQIQQLETSMRQLTELFTEVEGLVAEQDVQVDEINNNVQSAKQDIDTAVKQEDEALIKAKKARKKKCWCLWLAVIICIIIIIVVVVPIATHFSN